MRVTALVLSALLREGSVPIPRLTEDPLVNAIPQEGRSAFTAMLSTVPAQTEELEEQQRGQRSGDGLSQKLSRTPWQKASPQQNPSGSL